MRKAETPLSQMDEKMGSFVFNCMENWEQELTKDKKQEKLTEYRALGEYERAEAALNNSKYRISPRAVAAVATIVDQMVHDIGLFVVKKTINEYRADLKNRYLLDDDLCSLGTYSLFSQLATFSDFRSNPAKYDKKKVATDVDDADDTIVEDKTPQRMRDFSYYVGSIIKQHIATRPAFDKKGNTYHKAVNRVTDPLKLLISDLLQDFISNRMTNYLRVLLHVKDAKTVSDDQVTAALELMLLDSTTTIDSTFSLVSSNVKRLKDYDAACSHNRAVDEHNKKVAAGEATDLRTDFVDIGQYMNHSNNIEVVQPLEDTESRSLKKEVESTVVTDESTTAESTTSSKKNASNVDATMSVKKSSGKSSTKKNVEPATENGNGVHVPLPSKKTKVKKLDGLVVPPTKKSKKSCLCDG